MSRIMEFRCYPEVDFPPGGGRTVTWGGKVSIDLDWVAGAKPYTDPAAGIDATEVLMAGGRDYCTIDIPYGDFMLLWRAK